MPKSKPKISEKKYPVNINILKQLSFESSPTGKAVNWLLTAGKTIVFLTFAVVISSYIYRYTLDQKVEILRDKINTNKENIQGYGDIEYKIRNSQSKIDFLKTLQLQTQNAVQIYQMVESSLPQQSQLTLFSIDYANKTIQLRGKADNEIIFSQMLNAFKKQDRFTEINIDEINSGGVINPEITFTVNIFFN